MPIADLPAFKEKWNLEVAGGDPDLWGQPWEPKVFFKPKEE